MRLLSYHDLDFQNLKRKYPRVISLLEEGNFNALDVKKIPEAALYRVKLDYENRLLFRLGKFNGEYCMMLLEAVYNHDYAASRFLRGKHLDESKLQNISSPVKAPDIAEIPYLHPQNSSFHYLDKPISFDDEQQQFFAMRPPAIIIGSAGSGKTVLTLEKMKTLKGNVLYITLSPFLVQNSIKLYYSGNYENQGQEVDFLSFREFLETFRVPEGKEVDFRTFEAWFNRHRHAVKIKDAHKLFEEFGGVITGLDAENEYLSREQYLSLGVRQSVFTGGEREEVYQLFEKYLAFLKENNLYDLNIISHQWLPYCTPRYDFIVIDEIQDITPVQLGLVLKSLKKPGQFILCGDSNQVVHPNLFSWASIKSLFYKSKDLARETIKILHTNYRNSPPVIEIANKLLKIKNARFGSIDKESTYLVNTVSSKKGEVNLLADNQKNRMELNSKTKASARFAVIVMRNEDKAEARKIFQTPLLFSIHEAKGLEYENVILVNFTSNYDKEFREITDGINKEDIEAEDINFSRAKDKTDKSLDVYKFYVNSLYVAITRSVENLYLVEAVPRHKLFHLLDLLEVKEQVKLEAQSSSREEWNKEAIRLEQQGKLEQAEAIRESILGTLKETPWKPLTPENINQLKKEALNHASFNKKAKDKLFNYSLLYDDEETAFMLSRFGYKKAEKFQEERNSVFRKHYAPYISGNVNAVMNEVKKYGVDYRDTFNLTPLMAAVMAGSEKIAGELLDSGAHTGLTDNFGRNLLQLALFQSCCSDQYARAKLNAIYPLVVTDNIKVKVDDTLKKLNNHSIDFFVLNFMIAMQAWVLKNRERFEPNGIKVDDLIEKFSGIPENILYDYRKQRAYLSAHLAGNEVDKPSPTNRKLYKRVARGFYIINPGLEVLVDEKWVNVHELVRHGTMIKDYNLHSLRESIRISESMLKDYKNNRYTSYYGYSLKEEQAAHQERHNELLEQLREHIDNKVNKL